MLKIIKIYAKTAVVFSVTLALLYFLCLGLIKIADGTRHLLSSIRVPEPTVNRELPLVLNSRGYSATDQHWAMPEERFLLNPSSWLVGRKNCIIATRMNAMKFAGLVPGGWDMKKFLSCFSEQEIYQKFRLPEWPAVLNEKILSEISLRINGTTDSGYTWVTLNDMNELIYLVKRGQQAMIGITIWLKPTKKSPYPRKHLNSPISHSVTVTGIKAYYPDKDIIEFRTNDPYPFNFLIGVPVYSKIKSDGYSIFGRQAVPFINPKGNARSGYVVEAESLAAARSVKYAQGRKP